MVLESKIVNKKLMNISDDIISLHLRLQTLLNDKDECFNSYNPLAHSF